MFFLSVTGGKYKNDLDKSEEDSGTVLGDPKQDELPHVYQPKYDVSKSILNQLKAVSNFS